MKELRNLIGNDFDMRVEISPTDFKITISHEMWEEIEYTIIYDFDGVIHVGFSELEEWLDENHTSLKQLDYGICDDEITAINTVMNQMKLYTKDIQTIRRLCDKRGEDNLSDDD